MLNSSKPSAWHEIPHPPSPGDQFLTPTLSLPHKYVYYRFMALTSALLEWTPDWYTLLLHIHIYPYMYASYDLRLHLSTFGSPFLLCLFMAWQLLHDSRQKPCNSLLFPGMTSVAFSTRSSHLPKLSILSSCEDNQGRCAHSWLTALSGMMSDVYLLHRLIFGKIPWSNPHAISEIGNRICIKDSWRIPPTEVVQCLSDPFMSFYHYC